MLFKKVIQSWLELIQLQDILHKFQHCVDNTTKLNIHDDEYG
jgi:hypothetical protein